MKKILVSLSLLLTTLSLFAQKFGAFEIVDKGAIDFNSNYFQAEYAGDYQQRALKSFKVEKGKDTYKVSGKFSVKARSATGSMDMGGTISTGGKVSKSKTDCNFVKTIKKIKGGVEIESTLESPEANIGNDKISYAFYLPTMLYKDRLWFDDTQIKDFPKDKKSFKAKRIRVIMMRRVLEIVGDFDCDIFTTRWSPARSGMDLVGVRIHYKKVSDTLYSLKLTMKDLLLHHKCVNISSVANGNTEHPIPTGECVLANVKYKIDDDKKAIVIPAGGSFVFDCKKSWGAYVEILNAFLAFPTDKDIVGKVVVNYTNGKSETIEINKSLTGELNSDVLPKNATRAWQSKFNGKNVAFYTTELPLKTNRHVASMKFVNESSSAWTILAMSFNREKVGVVRNDEIFITANDIYQPIVYKRPALKNSALDMSNMLDAPAGKYGRIKVKDGKFVFEKTGKHVRFYGANTCGFANTPTHEQAISMAEQFSRMGLNVWRIHHYDARITTPKNGDSAELNLEEMEKFDFLFSEMKKRGIYVTTDFYTTRRLLPHEYDDIKYRGQNMKLVFAASDKAVQNLQRFITNFLTHVNPYTGLAYKDDPALFSVVVRNESSYVSTQNFVIRTPVDREAIRPKFEKYLKANREKWKNFKTETALFQLFLLDAYDETHAKLLKTIKDLSPNLLVSDQNHWHGFMTKAMSKTYDFSSQNSYFGHPLFPENKFRSPMYIRNDSPISNLGGSTVKASDSQIFDRPLIITEWCYVPPNLNYAQGPFLVGAYSSLNELGGLCYFAFSHGDGAILKNNLITTFDFASDPILSMAHRAAVMMYTRKDISPSPVSFPIMLLTNYFRNGSTAYYCYGVPKYSDLALVGRIGYVISYNVETAKLPENATAVLFSEPAWRDFDIKGALQIKYDRNNPFASQIQKANIGKAKIDVENKFYRSSTGELELDGKNENWKAVSKRTESFLLKEGQSLTGEFASVKSKQSLASVFISSLDGVDLKDSKRILILHLTDVKNTLQKFGDKEMSLVLSWGKRASEKTPTLVRAGKIDVTLQSSLDGYKLYALETNGNRLFEVPINRKNGVSNISLSIHNPKGSIIAYELVKE